MKNLDSYVNFVRGVKSAEETIRECEEQKTRLEQMKVLLQKNRDKDQSVGFGSNSQTFVSQLQAKIETIGNWIERLHGQIAQAKEKAALSRDSNLVQLEQEIER